MRIIIFLAFGLICAGAVQAQVGSSISSDGTTPNDNAMLDVQSPATGNGKGLLIPRVSQNQRTNANVSLDGGLLGGDGNLRGGAAQGLIVYQTDGDQGLYFNTSLTTSPAWVYLGNSTTNYLPLTGGTMSGALDMGAQIVTNVSYIDFNGNAVSVGRGANGSSGGAALGYLAEGYNNGAAVGRQANGTSSGAALGYLANGSFFGAALGDAAKGTNYGAAVGYAANGTNSGAALGRSANGSSDGAAVGYNANGSDRGAAMGRDANGSFRGAVVGYGAEGTNYGVAMGYSASGSDRGVAMGFWADGRNTNVAIGMRADARGGTNHIAIGNNVTNNLGNDTAVIRGTLYLDGGTGVMTRATFGGGGAWSNKAFEINHPLDPANKVLRHFCLEGPQVWNVYAGNTQLVNGQAMVQLPDYYSALNLVGSEIYSLTVIGSLAQVAVGAEVSENRFSIIGDKDVKVSWTIKVLRNDPACREDLRRRPVEQLKSELQAGSE